VGGNHTKKLRETTMSTIKAQVTRTLELTVLASINKGQTVPFDAGDTLASDPEGRVYLVKQGGSKTIPLAQLSTHVEHAQNVNGKVRTWDQDTIQRQQSAILDLLNEARKPLQVTDIRDRLMTHAAFEGTEGRQYDVLIRNRLYRLGTSGILKSHKEGGKLFYATVSN